VFRLLSARGLPGLVELFAVGPFGEFFSVVTGVASGAVTGAVTTGVGVGVGVLTGAGGGRGLAADGRGGQTGA
jgi:hypothetical protein